MTPITWYLVMIGGTQFIGPMTQSDCESASKSIAHYGVVCQQPVMTLCPHPDYPQAFTACPKFDFPEVRVKQ